MTRAELSIAGFLAVPFVLLANPCLGGNWLTAPQLCRGKAYSESARSAGWKFDAKHNASIAISHGTTTYTSVLPKEDANFVVNVCLRLPKDAACRLNIGDVKFDLSNLGTSMELAVGGKRQAILEQTGPPLNWTLFTIRRRAGKLSVEISGERSTDGSTGPHKGRLRWRPDQSTGLGSSEEAIKQIGLRSLKGEILVRNFVVTGDVQAVKP